MVFLDFSKAYDRLSRSWGQKCMSSIGFGQNACKWVSIMLQDTSASATFNGWWSFSLLEWGWCGLVWGRERRAREGRVKGFWMCRSACLGWGKEEGGAGEENSRGASSPELRKGGLASGVEGSYQVRGTADCVSTCRLAKFDLG